MITPNYAHNVYFFTITIVFTKNTFCFKDLLKTRELCNILKFSGLFFKSEQLSNNKKKETMNYGKFENVEEKKRKNNEFLFLSIS